MRPERLQLCLHRATFYNFSFIPQSVAEGGGGVNQIYLIRGGVQHSSLGHGRVWSAPLNNILDSPWIQVA